MKKDKTHIVTVLDRSGSMYSIREAMIKSLQELVEEQKQLKKECTFSLYRFSSTTELFMDFIDLETVEIDNNTLKPSGNTALLDCLGIAINETGERLLKLSEEERPEKVIFVVITDGQENSSTTFDDQQIKNMIEHQSEVYKWQFLFLAANQDAVITGTNLGIQAQSCLNYEATSVGTSESIRVASASLTNYRTGKTNQTSFVNNPKTSKL